MNHEETAQEAYDAVRAEVASLLDLIVGEISKPPTFGLRGLHWGHVGTLCHVRNRMIDAASALMRIPEGEVRNMVAKIAAEGGAA